MARKGENIYKRKDERWEGRYIKGRDASGKTEFGYVYAKSYREVREKLANAKASRIRAPTTNRMDLGYYCEEWLLLCRSRVKESTYVKYHNIIQRHIIPRLGKEMPQNLSTVAVERFSHGLLSDGFSPKTVRDILTVLRSVLKHGRRQCGEGFPEIEIIYPKEPRRDMRVLSTEEQTRLVQYLLNDMDTVKFGVLLALLTGMRIGEVCALKWSDISLQDKCVHITATMQRLQDLTVNAPSKTKVLIGEAKSDHSRRFVPLTEYAASLCEEMRPLLDDAYVLTGDTRRWMEPRALQYRLSRYSAACDLEGVHFHALRHTFATRCVEVGFEIKSLSEILGHSSTKVTLDRYVHSSMELKRANMEKLAAVGF